MEEAGTQYFSTLAVPIVGGKLCWVGHRLSSSNLYNPFIETPAMFTFTKWIAAAVLAGLIVMEGGVPSADAQPNGKDKLPPPPQANKMFRLLPGDDVNAAAKAAAIAAQSYAAEDAYRDTYNPYNVTNISGSPSGNQYMPGGSYISGYYGGYRNPYYGMGGYGGFSGYFDGGAGVLNASANIMDAQGRLMVSNQQAVLLQQAVQREKLRNKRRAFDEWLYERANTPTLEQLRQEALALELSRARNDPPMLDVLSAKSLNRLLNSLIQQIGRGGSGRDIRLEPEVLQHINVTSATNGASFGVLRNRGKLQWPLGLQDLAPADESRELRRSTEELIGEAISQAEKGRVQAPILNLLRKNIDALRAILKKNIHDMSPQVYMDAKRYLEEVENGIKVLERPDAAKYVNGTFQLDPNKIKTVGDLVRFMQDNGLTFAPAVTGDEAGYIALQRAMANYDVTTQAMLMSTQRPQQ